MQNQDYAYSHPQPPPDVRKSDQQKDRTYPSEKACRRDRPYWTSNSPRSSPRP